MSFGMIKNMVKRKIVLCGQRSFYCIHKADDIYNDIAEDVESTFDTSNYDQIEYYQKEKRKK